MFGLRMTSLWKVLGVFCLGAATLYAQPPASRSAKGPSSGGIRTRADGSGKYKLRASLVDCEDGKVRLRKTDGDLITIPLERLSETDREWVAKQSVADVPNNAAGPWPGWLGPNRDGHSPDTGLLKQWPAAGPKLLWKVNTLGEGWSSVAVANDRVYITGVSGENQGA